MAFMPRGPWLLVDVYRFALGSAAQWMAVIQVWPSVAMRPVVVLSHWHAGAIGGHWVPCSAADFCRESPMRACGS